MTTLTTPADPTPAPALNGTADPGPLRAAHTPNFPALLRELGASLSHGRGRVLTPLTSSGAS
jgi:hypothetical protein